MLRDPVWSGFSLDAPPRSGVPISSSTPPAGAPRSTRPGRANPEPSADSGLAERFAAHMESLGTLSEYFLARIGMTLRFEVSGPAGGTWDAHIGPRRVRSTSTAARARGLPAAAGRPLARRRRHRPHPLGGAAALAAVLARREPDHYNDYLVGLLKHADLAALRAVEEFESARDPYETIEVEDRGRRVQVSRYCPHAGEDLAETAVVATGCCAAWGTTSSST